MNTQPSPLPLVFLSMASSASAVIEGAPLAVVFVMGILNTPNKTSASCALLLKFTVFPSMLVPLRRAFISSMRLSRFS